MKNSSKYCMHAVIILLVCSCTPSQSPNFGKLELELFQGQGIQQPLVVGFGGSEGGNAWASDYWKAERDQFIKDGYAFLAVGYFGGKGTPDNLDRISIDAIHDSIFAIAKRHPNIDPTRIALIGGSKGGELVLNLASYYDDIGVAIAIVPSHVSFPAHTLAANTSSWTLHGEELRYVPSTWASVPALLRRDLHAAFTEMLTDSIAVKRARIPVENINGAVLLLSATEDEMWPSTMMSMEIMNQLDSMGFSFPYEHVAYGGSHAAPLDHFDMIHSFLKLNLGNRNSQNRNAP